MSISRRKFLKRVAWATGATGLGCLYPAYIEPHHVQVSRLRYAVPNLPYAWDGMTIAHLTDLHRSAFVGLDYLNRCIDVANALHPQLTIFTGDYITHGLHFPHADISVGNTPRFLGECVRCMARARAPLGVLATLGNHDHWYNGDRVTAAIQSAGIPVLRNQNTRITVNGEALSIVGLGDLCTEGVDLRRAFQGVDDPFSLVLTHNPDVFASWARPGAHLILAGHTHGGQVNLPFVGAPIVPSRYVRGFFRRGDSTMYVNRGVGLIFPPVRFNCPPEIALIQLQRA